MNSRSFNTFSFSSLSVLFSGRRRARIRFSSAGKCATCQFLIGVKQCGGHSPGTRWSFGIECIQA